MLDTTLVKVFAYEAGELYAYAKLIEQEPTKAGTPRRDLVEHARHKLEWIKAMMQSIESDLQRVEAGGIK
jgi:CRISPR/Cas system-associated exonuclease Cas4 (RecB family)